MCSMCRNIKLEGAITSGLIRPWGNGNKERTDEIRMKVPQFIIQLHRMRLVNRIPQCLTPCDSRLDGLRSCFPEENLQKKKDMRLDTASCSDTTYLIEFFRNAA